MRALIVILLVALSFTLVVLLYPAADGSGGSPKEARAGFVESPPAPGEADREPVRGFLVRDAGDSPTAPARNLAEPEPGVAPDWLSNLDVPEDPVGEGERRLAERIVHGSDAEVLDALRGAGLDSNRTLLVRSFSSAMAGQVRSAIRMAGDLDEARLSPVERSLLTEALGGDASPIGVTRAEWGSGGLEQGMGMRLVQRRAEEFSRASRYARAAGALSELLMAELEAPWTAHRDALARWTELLDRAQLSYRWNPDGGWPGVTLTVQPGDTAIAVRKRYLASSPGALMCSGLILRANAVEGYLQPGQELRVPTEPVRVLVDLSARWALYQIGEDVAGSWPVGIGRPGEETRTGVFRAGNKLENPPWMKVGQQPVPFGHPDNPLGTRWIGWFDGERPTSFGFHGTWEPESIGTASSDGCVRFHNEGVEQLFEILPEGSQILVRP